MSEFLTVSDSANEKWEALAASYQRPAFYAFFCDTTDQALFIEKKLKQREHFFEIVDAELSGTDLALTMRGNYEEFNALVCSLLVETGRTSPKHRILLSYAGE